MRCWRRACTSTTWPGASLRPSRPGPATRRPRPHPPPLPPPPPHLGPRALPEVARHLRQAGALAIHAGVAAPVETGPGTRRRLRRLGLASLAGFTAAFLAVEAANGFSTSHLTSADRPDHPVASAPLTQADVARDQAAAWVASEGSAGAIRSCAPAMCAGLVRHGFPAANLPVLRPGAPDPLGSAVVLATPAVRSMFR